MISRREGATTPGKAPRARSLRWGLGGSALWLLLGALAIPYVNDHVVAIRLWCGLLGIVAVGTLVLSVGELRESRTRIAGFAGGVAALALGAAALLFWSMAGSPP